ncbi:MAG: putative Monomeric sarcosine oxidase [Acidimicrobiales bacterium]|nr:putative Monomeric sarcosine oxidase [Acidimicrobiales bacterium]
MPERCDVVVVGAGMAGSATAWWLARRGVDVVVLEQFEAGHRRGSSHGATRLFRLGYADPADVRRGADALRLWRTLEAEAGRELLVTTGSLDHGDPAQLAAIAAAYRHEGVPSERLDAAEASARWPGLRFAGDVLVQPDGGRILADATVAALQERAVAHGAEVLHGTGPAAIVTDADQATVRAGDRTWAPRTVVVTAGAWLPSVLGGAVSLPPLTVTCEQVQHFVPYDTTATWPSFIHHHAPTVYGLFAPGEGVKVATHHAGPVVDPDDRPFGPDPATSALVAAYVAEWLPGVDPTPVHPARCLYTSTADERFVLERHGPIVIGSPCSGHGFKFAPLIGRTLADLAVPPRGPA